MKQAKVLNEQEMKRLHAVVAAGNHADRNRLMIMLSFLTGMRVGEISKLKVSDVLLDDGQIADQVHLSASYTKHAFSRTVFFNTKLRKEIRKYFDALPGLPALDAHLIQSQKGKSFSPNSLCQLFARIYAQAGIKNASSHSGRRSFITKLAHSGISAKVIMELAGHKNLTTTQRYIDVNDEMKRQAVEVV